MILGQTEASFQGWLITERFFYTFLMAMINGNGHICPFIIDFTTLR